MTEKSGWQKLIGRLKKVLGGTEEEAAERPKSRDEIAAEVFRQPARPRPPVDTADGDSFTDSPMFRQPRMHEAAAETSPLTTAEQQAQQRWHKAMPICLNEFWRPMMSDLDTVDYRAMRLALMEEYSTPAKQALALFAWYGQGLGDWQTYPKWETVPEQFLMEIPLPALVEALEENPLDEAHLEGAARFFAGDLFQALRGHELAQLPTGLKEAFTEHVQAHGDGYKIAQVAQMMG